MQSWNETIYIDEGQGKVDDLSWISRKYAPQGRFLFKVQGHHKDIKTSANIRTI
jgi:hypothetical protein